jgi:hypothetical protein
MNHESFSANFVMKQEIPQTEWQLACPNPDKIKEN